MRGVISIIALTAVLLAAQSSRADEAAVDSPENPRRPTPLMSQAAKAPVKVDLAALAERKLAMFEGGRYYRAPVRETDGTVASVMPGARRGIGAKREEETAFRFGALGWTLMGVLVAGIIAAWRLGWFVPFSARQAKKPPASALASGKSRRARKAGPRIELVKRG